MTPDEAARLLNVNPNAQRREVDTALASLRSYYVSQLQLSTEPHERDAAVRAVAVIQEAYAVLTGQSAADANVPIVPASDATYEEIPRVSLGGKKVTPKRSYPRPVSTPTQGSWKNWRDRLLAPWPPTFVVRPPTRETVVAYVICAIIVLAAILLLLAAR